MYSLGLSGPLDRVREALTEQVEVQKQEAADLEAARAELSEPVIVNGSGGYPPPILVAGPELDDFLKNRTPDETPEEYERRKAAAPPLAAGFPGGLLLALAMGGALLVSRV